MLLALDTETKGKNAREFVLGCVIDENMKERYFYDPETMWNWLIAVIEKQAGYGKNVYIYAHGHEYDFYGYAQNHLKDKNIVHVSSYPFIKKWKKNGYFLDLRAFYSMSLKEVGKIVGLRKKETPKILLDGSITEDQIEEVKPYCLRDTVIVMKAILKIKSTINELGFKPKTLITAGQVAVSSFMNYTKRAGIMEEFCVVKKNEKGQIYNYYIPNSKNAWRIRKAYRGARKEAFVTGKYHGVSLYDVNALYPYAMTQMKFPNLFSELFVLEPYKKGYNNDLLFAHIGVMKCKIRAPVKIKVAFLPIRYKGIVVYPRNTTMSGVWTIGEIKKAVGLGYELLDIEWAIMYPEARVNPFEEYIKHLYDLRLKSKGDLGYVIKLIMNNLYGKFAQDRAIYEYKFIKRMEMDKYEAEGWEYIRSNEDGFTIGKYKGKYRPRYVNPLISALITAEARGYLYDFMNLVDAKDLLYVDTDSIMFTNEAKYRKVFKVNQKIGQWKVLFKNEKACIMRENEYYIGNVLKMSGIGKIYQNRKVIEEGGKICVDRMITFRQGIKTGKMDKVGTFEKVTKEFTVGNKQDIIVPDYIEE